MKQRTLKKKQRTLKKSYKQVALGFIFSNGEQWDGIGDVDIFEINNIYTIKQANARPFKDIKFHSWEFKVSFTFNEYHDLSFSNTLFEGNITLRIENKAEYTFSGQPQSFSPNNLYYGNFKFLLISNDNTLIKIN